MLRLTQLLVLFSVYIFGNSLKKTVAPSSPIPTPFPYGNIMKLSPAVITIIDAFNIFGLGLSIAMILLILSVYYCSTIRFTNFRTDLSFKPITKTKHKYSLLTLMLSIFFWILLNEHNETWYSLLLILLDTNFRLNFRLSTQLTHMLNRVFSFVTTYTFYLAITPTYILCIFVFQNSCCYITKNSPEWLHVFLIILSNDIHQNPGPIANSFFTFMNWNVNSIAKDNFHCLKLLWATTSISFISRNFQGFMGISRDLWEFPGIYGDFQGLSLVFNQGKQGISRAFQGPST